MTLVKIKLSIIERVKEIFHGIDWLSLTVIDVHKVHDFYDAWYRERHSFIDRWESFLSCVDTAIRGYVWGLKE